MPRWKSRRRLPGPVSFRCRGTKIKEDLNPWRNAKSEPLNPEHESQTNENVTVALRRLVIRALNFRACLGFGALDLAQAILERRLRRIVRLGRSIALHVEPFFLELDRLVLADGDVRGQGDD